MTSEIEKKKWKTSTKLFLFIACAVFLITIYFSVITYNLVNANNKWTLAEEELEKRGYIGCFEYNSYQPVYLQILSRWLYSNKWTAGSKLSRYIRSIYQQWCVLIDFEILPIKDEFIQKLPASETINSINFSSTQITIKGISSLTKYPKLSILKLNNLESLIPPNLSKPDQAKKYDQFISTITQFDNLTHLELINIPYDSIHLKDLLPLADLEYLDVSKTDLNDDGLIKIELLKSLTELNISHCPVTDQGIKTLSNSKSLTHISLNNTRITNGCISYLLSMPQLQVINISNTEISEDGIKRLQTKLDVTFSRDQQ